MKFNRNKLYRKLEAYFTGKISKIELGRWANQAYYDILKGGYIENEKIVVYPFLRKIATFHLEENDKEDIYPCSEESVKKIWDILSGKVDTDFNIEVSLLVQIYTMFKEKIYYDKEKYNLFLKLRENIVLYLKGKGQTDNNIKMQLEEIRYWNSQKETIQDLLEMHIIQFLNSFFSDHFKLFVKESKQNNILAERFLNYLDSYLGNRNFYLLVSYSNGKPNIFLVV